MIILILAAGSARRMGRQKLLLPLDGRPIIAHVVAAAAAWPTVVVASDDVAGTLDPRAVRIVRNTEPERGMTHSLRLGSAAVDAREAIAVLLGDLPDITPADIGRAVDAYDDSVDVVVPHFANEPAHPVIFGPRARRRAVALPDGDTLRRVRDDPGLRRRFVPTDRSALMDIDTPADYAERTRRPTGTSKSSP